MLNVAKNIRIPYCVAKNIHIPYCVAKNIYSHTFKQFWALEDCVVTSICFLGCSSL